MQTGRGSATGWSMKASSVAGGGPSRPGEPPTGSITDATIIWEIRSGEMGGLGEARRQKKLSSGLRGNVDVVHGDQRRKNRDENQHLTHFLSQRRWRNIRLTGGSGGKSTITYFQKELVRAKKG